MGPRVQANFDKRFSEDVIIHFLEKPLNAAEAQFRNETIFGAFNAVLSGIFGRCPTQKEIFGITDISKDIKRLET